MGKSNVGYYKISYPRCAQGSFGLLVAADSMNEKEFAGHTIHVSCSGNKKAQMVMRHKISSGITGQKEARPSQAWWGYQHMRKTEIRELRTWSYSGWDGEEEEKRASEWWLCVTGSNKTSKVLPHQEDGAQLGWGPLKCCIKEKKKSLFYLKKSQNSCYLPFPR